MPKGQASIRMDVDALDLAAEQRRVVNQVDGNGRTDTRAPRTKSQRSIGDMIVQMEKQKELQRFKETFGLDEKDIVSQPSTFPPYVRLQARIPNAGNMKIFNFPFPIHDTRPEALFSPEEVRVAKELASHYSGKVTVSTDSKRGLTALAVVTERDTIRVATLPDKGDTAKNGTTPAVNSSGSA